MNGVYFRCWLSVVLLAVCGLAAPAQLYTGMSGMMHVPSAEMNHEGDICVGGYFLNKHFTPDHGFSYEGERYNTMSFYLSITPFWWVEVGYDFTLFKTLAQGHDKPGYNQKDRYFSLKFNPLRETRWLPAVAIGGNDFFSTSFEASSEGGGQGNCYFSNLYIAATKHFNYRGNIFGVNVAYRRFKRRYNHKYNGLVGGLTYRPPFSHDLRVMAEYSGDGINIGADYLLFRHLFIQAAFQDCRYPSFGIAFRANLF